MLLNYAASMRLSPVQPFVHREGLTIEKALASRATKSYTAAFRGDGKPQSSNRFEAISVYGTTGLERCRERLLCSLDLPGVARGTINADIKCSLNVRGRSLLNENSNQNPTDQDSQEAEDQDGSRS